MTVLRRQTRSQRRCAQTRAARQSSRHCHKVRESARLAARNSDGIASVIVRLEIEQRTGGIEGAGSRGHARECKLRIAGSVDMACGSRDSGAARGIAQDAAGIERQITEIDQVGRGATDRLRVENLLQSLPSASSFMVPAGKTVSWPAQWKRSGVSN